jgi:prepilin-type N-terminal cleavage/methylation domain-containing protein
MLSKLRKRNEGFTIIEVLIVLAIAGLILLIVFLAVPALQRNAHNTSAKNDVSGILGGINEYVNNNNGTLPSGNSGSGNSLTVGTGSTVNTATVKLGYYDASNVSIVTSVPSSAPGVGSVAVVLKASCNGNTPTVDATATPRAYAAYFTLEGGAKICQQGS